MKDLVCPHAAARSPGTGDPLRPNDSGPVR